MTLEQAKKLKKGDIIYSVDSFVGSYPVEVTDENNFVGTYVSQKVSMNFLTQRFNFGHDFYPCYAYELTYEEAHKREMRP